MKRWRQQLRLQEEAMTAESVPALEPSQPAEDAGKQPTSYEDLLRYAQIKVEEDKSLLDALLSSSARSSHAI
jgi:hypothetical protein